MLIRRYPVRRQSLEKCPHTVRTTSEFSLTSQLILLAEAGVDVIWLNLPRTLLRAGCPQLALSFFPVVQFQAVSELVAKAGMRFFCVAWRRQCCRC